MTTNCTPMTAMVFMQEENTTLFSEIEESIASETSLSSFTLSPRDSGQGDTSPTTQLDHNVSGTADLDSNSNSQAQFNVGPFSDTGETVSNDEVTQFPEEHQTDPHNTPDHIESLGVAPDHTHESTELVEIQTTAATTDPHTSSHTNNHNNRDRVEETNMGDENLRLEEKLRQFQIDAKKDETEDSKGSYSSIQLSESEKQRRRNLIFDEERFEETFLKCLICREMYNEIDKLPKMLHCHHTFCMDCLYQMYRVEGEFRQSLTGVFRALPMTVKILCPTCREGVLISEPELKRLPNDHTIMELLCFVSQTNKHEVQYCTKHQMQPLNFFCEPCIMPVCCDCTVIDHKESKGHVVVNVDEAMEKYAPIVEETLEEIKSEKAGLAEKREALESAQEDIDVIQRDLTSQIRQVFDSIRLVLDERERELYDIADAEIERKREILDGHMRVLMERETELNAEFSDLEHAKEDKDISLIFTGHKSAQDVLSRKVKIPLNSTQGFAVTFQFSSRIENSIKQQIVNLGDIIFHS